MGTPKDLSASGARPDGPHLTRRRAGSSLPATFHAGACLAWSACLVGLVGWHPRLVAWSLALALGLDAAAHLVGKIEHRKRPPV